MNHKMESIFFETQHLYRCSQVSKLVYYKSNKHTTLEKSPSCIDPLLYKTGCYAWFFDDGAIKEIEARQGVGSFDASGCFQREGLTLLYIGTSSAKNNPKTKRTIDLRLKRHIYGKKRYSTLRRSIDALLNTQAGESKSTENSSDENDLTSWLKKHTYLCWVATDTPRELEKSIFHSEHCPWLPLNISENHPQEEGRKRWLKHLSAMRKVRRNFS